AGPEPHSPTPHGARLRGNTARRGDSHSRRQGPAAESPPRPPGPAAGHGPSARGARRGPELARAPRLLEGRIDGGRTLELRVSAHWWSASSGSSGWPSEKIEPNW